MNNYSVSPESLLHSRPQLACYPVGLRQGQIPEIVDRGNRTQFLGDRRRKEDKPVQFGDLRLLGLHLSSALLPNLGAGINLSGFSSWLSSEFPRMTLPKESVEAVLENGWLKLVQPLKLDEHSRIGAIVAPLEERTNDAIRSVWLQQSEMKLNEVWDNPEDDVFNELLSK